MDTAITRAEHEEFRRTVDANFDALIAEDKRLNERLKVVEETNRQISDMNITLQKQSDNITKLSENISAIAKAQDAENKRLKELESRDGKKWRTAVDYALTLVVGLLVGFIATRLGIG
ncbi:MAG: hypothetical protein LIO59_07335 [Oscillospiraceae bacterium]|nr:hypothetical protein [Oscillospiraceae bacterium]